MRLFLSGLLVISVVLLISSCSDSADVDSVIEDLQAEIHEAGFTAEQIQYGTYEIYGSWGNVDSPTTGPPEELLQPTITVQASLGDTTEQEAARALELLRQQRETIEGHSIRVGSSHFEAVVDGTVVRGAPHGVPEGITEALTLAGDVEDIRLPSDGGQMPIEINVGTCGDGDISTCLTELDEDVRSILPMQGNGGLRLTFPGSDAVSVHMGPGVEYFDEVRDIVRYLERNADQFPLAQLQHTPQNFKLHLSHDTGWDEWGIPESDYNQLKGVADHLRDLLSHLWSRIPIDGPPQIFLTTPEGIVLAALNECNGDPSFMGFGVDVDFMRAVENCSVTTEP